MFITPWVVPDDFRGGNIWQIQTQQSVKAPYSNWLTGEPLNSTNIEGYSGPGLYPEGINRDDVFKRRDRIAAFFNTTQIQRVYHMAQTMRISFSQYEANLLYDYPAGGEQRA